MQEKKSLANYQDLGKHNDPNGSISYLSNSLDSLTSSFLTSLKKSLNEGCLRQILVFPTNVIKNRLVQELVKNHDIFFGVRFLSMPQAIEHIVKLLCEDKLLFPHHHHMMIFLFAEIEIIRKNCPNAYPELTNYLQSDQEKSLHLAEQLSHTFLSYGLYGKEALPNWLNQNGWQQELFKKAERHWDFPHTFLNKIRPISIPTHFHFFNIPQIPEIYRNLLAHIPATFYQRIPTPHFVMDVLSDRKVARVDQKLKQDGVSPSERLYFHQISKEPNRLLANFLYVDPDMTEWLFDQDVEEDFSPPEGETRLKMEQRGIFQLEKCQEKPLEEDVTIQIHAAPSKFREIEVIYELLCKAFSQDPSLCVDDIQIIAPDIEPYAPAIEYTFGKSESPFGYIIEGVRDDSRLSFNGVIKSFFALAYGRFKPKEIKDILSAPWIAPPQNCDEEQLRTFWNLFDKLHLHWGFDKKMRQEILETDGVTDKGTFQDAFSRLIESLSYLSSPLDLSDAEAFGELVAYLSRLSNDLRRFKELEATPTVWIETMIEIVETYVVDCDERERFLKQFYKLAPLDKLVDQPIPYPVISLIIDEITQAKQSTLIKKDLPPLNFSSIDDTMIASPKITVLIGMDEEAFPRSVSSRSLDQLQIAQGAEKRPTKAEKDKNFFFEAIAYTQGRLIISYTQLSDRDGKELYPSLVVEDLMSVTEGIEIMHHPPLAPRKTEKGETLHITPKQTQESLESTEISQLSRLATHPLRFYLQNRCGIYLGDDDEQTEKEMREFVLSYRKKAEIRQIAYQKESTQIKEEIEKNNALPTALFSIAAKIEVDSEIEEAKKSLTAFGISQEDFISILFDPAVENPSQRNRSEYLHPPLVIDGVTIYGKIDRITRKGLFSFSDDTIASLFKEWPKLLILLTQKEWAFPSTILFAKDQKIKDLEIKEPEESLKRFIEYYKKASLTPSPLLPDHIKTYAKHKTAPRKGGLFKDPYLEAIEADLTIDWMPYIEEVL